MQGVVNLAGVQPSLSTRILQWLWHLFRWVASLPLARVLRWGGMISTPDAALQSVMRRSLLDSGCPMHCIDELMDSAHERRWPPGLGTLEMRQQNRRHFENYVCRRIPGIYIWCEEQLLCIQT